MKVAIIDKESIEAVGTVKYLEITAEHCEFFKIQAKDIEAIFIYGVTNDRLKRLPRLSRFLNIVSSKFLHTIAEII